MNDEYLWTAAGPPDPEIERLEGALRPFGHRRQPLKLPSAARPAKRWLGMAILAAGCFAISVLAWSHARPPAAADGSAKASEVHFRSYDAGPVDGSE